MQAWGMSGNAVRNRLIRWEKRCSQVWKLRSSERQFSTAIAGLMAVVLVGFRFHSFMKNQKKKKQTKTPVWWFVSLTLERGGARMYHLQSTASVAPAFPSLVI